ncbi:hypothetical protein Tco_0725620 [Tanacetum coccineum]|uniref:Uncharacterized protein n=1 Tax=Tanacetum coccineum TaxID=301880 RepID=A0ABQ4YDC1_9ASTR
MAAVSNVPQLVDKNGGSYAAIAPKIESGKFNKWKKRVLCYLAGIEPYYIKCIKDDPFQPKTTKDDIIESVISCETAKATWTNLVHNFEGPSDTKENRIMNLKLEYQTFRAKSTESLSQTYTRYKTLRNELANDGVNLFKHEINVGFVNRLLEKWLTFSQGLRNANHTQTLDLADIYGMFDFQENYDDEVDERSSEEYLRDLDIEFHERALLANSKSDDGLTVGKNHACNGEWIDITIRKVNILLSMDEDADWQNYLKYINIDLKFVEESFTKLRGNSIDLPTPLSKREIRLRYHETYKPKTQDSLIKSVPGTVTVSETEPTTPLVPTEVKDTKQESKINELTKLV